MAKVIDSWLLNVPTERPTRREQQMKSRFSVRIRSFSYAFRGIATMLRTQHNAWIHAAATVVVIVAGLIFGLSNFEWIATTLVIVAVWTAEALNTAFESLCDVASPDFHPKVERAKDVAAGAVLISALGAVAVGLLVFGPKILAHFGS